MAIESVKKVLPLARMKQVSSDDSKKKRKKKKEKRHTDAGQPVGGKLDIKA